jgi:hypothetical protein
MGVLDCCALIGAVPIGNIGEIAVRQLGYESHDLILLIGALRLHRLKRIID